jgi:hypothetical protein
MGEAGRRECAGRRAGGFKVKQEKRPAENKRWKKSKRVKSETGEAPRRE